MAYRWNPFTGNFDRVDGSGGNLPPEVATQYQTDSGIAIPIANVLNIVGELSSAGNNPIFIQGAGNTVVVGVQVAQALPSADITTVGMATFDSADFIVDSQGFVSLAGAASDCICTEITGDTVLLVNSCNYTNFAEGATLTLPATAELCDTIEVNFGSQGVPTIAQNALQQIRFGNTTSTIGITGGMTATATGDCIKLKCVVGGTSTRWVVISSIGTWNVF